MAETETLTIDKIGQVTLDYSKYPGEDLYCDGAVEDEILAIVKNLSPVEYATAVEEHKNWPVLYHLSPLRENIADWLPMDRSMKVLEVGSGCGAVTGALAKKAGSVTCVDLSKKRSLINAYRHAECDNVTIHVGNFKDIEPDLPCDYDYICLIGVFEYAVAYMGGEHPFEDFLNILKKHLSENGRIVIAIENKYGLKYFAGCKEDHLGTWFSGIENYPEGGSAKTFGRNGLEKIFKNCGVEEYHFYYPYPDYKFMTTLYSDEYLPGKGELSNNLRNFDRDRMLLFDEKNAFDGIIEESLFPVFSNSYLVVIGKRPEVKYAKYSNDRAPEYAIRTEIRKDEEEKITVRKYPAGPEASEHVRAMAVACRQLSDRYEGGKLQVNQCSLYEENGEIFTEFEFVRGVTLSELMDACLERQDMDGFRRLFHAYLERISYHSDCPVSDYDLIFSNLLVDGDTWTMIDYEWTFGKSIETKELAFRALYCYLLENEKRNCIDLAGLLEELQITEAEAEAFREQERDFQSFVTGRRLAMAQMRDLIGHRVIEPCKWVDKYQDADNVNRVQVYEDTGRGFLEEESYFVKDAYQGDRLIETTLHVNGNVRVLRIDPAFASCVVRILEMTFNGQPVPIENRKVLLINGRIAKPATCIFPTEDPNIHIVLTQLPNRQAENTLFVRMEVARVPLSMTTELATSVKKIF